MIHYNEAYYPDPYRFDPDRWLNKTANHTWLPFAYLQRSCIGREFALLELRVVLAMLFSRFTFRVDTQRCVGFSVSPMSLYCSRLCVYIVCRLVECAVTSVGTCILTVLERRVVGPRSVITSVPFEGMHVFVKPRSAPAALAPVPAH